jgi:hypothetical protein
VIKATARAKNGQPAHIIGLSKVNIDKLMSGFPIAFPMSEMTGNQEDVAVMILIGGETEEAIIEELTKHGFDMAKPSPGSAN